MDPKSHWEKVYRTKRPTEVSWYRPHLEVSLQLIEEAASNRDANIIDVGAGESTLVDDLLARGCRNLYAMDLSSTALGVAKSRLGANATKVNWLCGDVRTFAFGRHRCDVWHDRAVFHFLTDAGEKWFRIVGQAGKWWLCSNGRRCRRGADHETTTQEPFSKVQGHGGAGGDPGRQDLGRVVRAIQVHPNQIGQWRLELLERAAEVFAGWTIPTDLRNRDNRLAASTPPSGEGAFPLPRP